jgi:hypothetical protein
MLVKSRVLAFFIAGCDELVTLVFDPFPQAELVLSGAEQIWLLLRVFAALSRWDQYQTSDDEL